MNPKIEKLRVERGKHTEKIEALQSRVRVIDDKIMELENLDIVGMVRERGVTPEMLIQLLNAMHGAPVPKTLPQYNRMEDTHEED
ncbi:MAG: DUF4315 family protein [Synergistaceae bacterium]|nr:DUF4315 family protein [Synergistaceae bacterium]